MSRNIDTGSSRRRIRWWPAIAIVILEIALLVWAWTRDVGSVQHKVVPTFPILFFCTLGLFVWLVLFSRLPGRLRLSVFAGVTVLVALGFALLEIKAVDGNLVPILGFRWSSTQRFDDSTAPRAGMATASALDYPQLYGPERRATLPGPRLARDWEIHPPRELWRREVGAGFSAFAVFGGAAVTIEQRGEDEVVVRYDLRTGRQVWMHAVRAPFNTTVGGSGPRSTPTIHENRVYSLGASGNLRCLNLETGDTLWSRNVLDDHGVERPDWGMASSPLVTQELVMVQLGNRGEGLAAYDRTTGEPAWRSGEDRGTYTSPSLATVTGEAQVLVVYRDSVVAHHPLTGAVLWRHEWPNPGGERVTMPLVIDDDRILVSAGYGVGSRMLRLGDEDGSPRAELV